MNWIILGVALVVICVVAGIAACKTCSDCLTIVSAVAGMAAFACLLASVIGIISADHEIAEFERLGQYIESHVSDDPIQDAALTNKKIELNQWLYSAQYANETYGSWSFYPDGVQTLEPIQ